MAPAFVLLHLALRTFAFSVREIAPRMRPLESCMNEQCFLCVRTQIYSFFPGWLGSKPLKKHWL